MPLIISDPSAKADATRGTVSEALVEGIDLAPTFVSYFGGEAQPHILEGKDLSGILQGDETSVRDFAISEYDYTTREARVTLGLSADDARLIMCADQRWKYWHTEGYRPMLFDLLNDPQELIDLGESDDPEHVAVRATMHERIFEWARRHHTRITRTHAELDAITNQELPGITIGVWDEEDYKDAFGHPFSERP